MKNKMKKKKEINKMKKKRKYFGEMTDGLWPKQNRIKNTII